MPQQPDTDVVIIGAGLGGLSAGALLTAAGLRVTVIEKNERPGGCAQTFVRDGVTFDPAIHFTIDAGPGGYTPKLLQHLGVADQVSFVATERTYRAYYPGTVIDAPPGRDAFLAAHQKLFPAAADGLQRLFEMRQDLFAQLASLPQKIDPDGLDEAYARCPLVFRHRMSTLAEVLDEFLDDPHATAAMASIWPYVGTAPSRVSFLLFNQMLESMHAGTYYALGSFQTLADALADAITDNGGALLCGHRATKISIDAGRVSGVEIDGADTISASAVISNIDARQTYQQLIDGATLPTGLARRLDRSKLSPSAFVLYGWFDCDPRELGLAEETLIFDDWDHERTWKELQSQTPGGIWISAPSMIDPSLAPDGRQLGIITSLVPATADGSWRDRKQQATAQLLEVVDRAGPDVSAHFTVAETATPDTLHRYTGTCGGAAYGWENIPSQTASKRLGHRGPFDGLYLCGHWTEEGTSSLRVLTSGRNTAALVGAELGAPRAVPDFGGPSFIQADRRS